MPYRLHDKTVYLLDMAALVAGTQFRGQFESRMKGLIEEVKRLGNVILFIDEVHSIVGTGDSEGSMSASNILKPALSRGEVQVIGATTFSEYRKYIEKDAALERRFQPVTVNEPTIADACRMLEGIKKYYEAHHKIHVSDAMIRECVQLSERYITDRYLPDKAIDLLDEACAYASTRNSALEEFEKLTDESAAADLAVEEAESSSEKEENPDYEKIAELKMNQMRISNRLEELKPQADAAQVTEKDLAQVIEVWTGIPASKIEATEFEKIRSLPEILSARVIGQEEAIKAVSAAIRRSRIHLSKRIRPASFIFVGPTGVGKTELAKALAQALFDDEKNMVRIDMSEYMEKFSVSRLIGAPPGYVGYEEGGQLTEAVRRRPYSVVLLDEVEKAHPDVFNILLQVLDDGRITDSQGRTVDFKNTIIILTSNLGSQALLDGIQEDGSISPEAVKNVEALLHRSFRPEFLNRLDEIVYYKPLRREEISKIVKLMIAELDKRLEDKRIHVEVSEKAMNAIIEQGFDPSFGARPLKRFIQRNIETLIAKKIIAGEIDTDSTVMVDYGEGGFTAEPVLTPEKVD